MQGAHGVDIFGFGRAVLPGPALDLPRNIVFALAEVAQADPGGIEAVKLRDGGIHRVIDGGALGRIDAGHLRLPEYAAIDKIHVYFRLKDDKAVLEAVIWKGTFGRMRVRPEEGLDVIVSGKLTTFAGSSKYQIVIDSLEPAGIGALMKLLEERKKKLAAEGLFDEARKQLLPFLPKVIGVITSPTGAVIRDILHRLQDRFPRRVLVWPVRVQGETSAAEVAGAIHAT